MKDNGEICTWGAICEYILQREQFRDDFVLVLSEADFELGRLKKLPEDKIFRAQASERGAILNAAGLALEGKRPWIAASSASVVNRTYGTIREAIVEAGLPVVTMVSDGGLSRGSDGVSKLMVEDLALMRALPGMSIYVPSDLNSAFGVGELLAAGSAPAYLRLDLTDGGNLGGGDEPYRAGGARILREGGGVTVCACGIMTKQALRAAEVLEQQGISTEVIDCYSIKPFPEQTLLSSVKRTGCCVAAEEHSVIGGLGGAAAECLAQTYPVPMRFVGIADEFVNSGTPEELREYYGLTKKEIVSAAAQVWALRRRQQ